MFYKRNTLVALARSSYVKPQARKRSERMFHVKPRLSEFHVKRSGVDPPGGLSDDQLERKIWPSKLMPRQGGDQAVARGLAAGAGGQADRGELRIEAVRDWAIAPTYHRNLSRHA